MTYIVERYFHRRGRTYGPYLYVYRSERQGGHHRCVYVAYLGKGQRPLEIDGKDVHRALDIGEGDLADAVRIVKNGEEFVVFDFETTGFSPKDAGVIQVSAVRCRARGLELEVSNSFTEFVNPGKKIPPMIIELTNISNEMVADARGQRAVLDDFKRWIGNRPVVGHNVAFDLRFLGKRIPEKSIVDTMRLSRALYGMDVKHRLPDVAKREGISLRNSKLHRADEDTRITAECFMRMARKLEKLDRE